MGERAWTKDQQEAINTKYTSRGKSTNILVNAAAGSGKTAVLVERVIKKIIPDDNNISPIDVDKLLVVTFTNAAAAEMKERISQALSDRLDTAELDGDVVLQDHIRRQMSLLYSADITTIDAFCMKVIKENFHLLGIDPNFGIADSAQLALIAEEAMEELFDDLYDSDDEGFILLCDNYSDGRDDSDLADIIYEMYDFVRALPNPFEWLFEKAEMFLLEDSNPWVSATEKKRKNYLGAAKRELKNAIKYMSKISGITEENVDETIEKFPAFCENVLENSWGSCYEIIYTEYKLVKELLSLGEDELVTKLQTIQFERWGKAASIRNKDLEIKDKELKATVKEMRDNSRKYLDEVIKTMAFSLPEIKPLYKDKLYPVARAFANVVYLYDKKFKEKKAKKNVLDFSDIEHLCLRVFRDNEEVCESFRKKYEEILMDEYQDSNSLQEEIFKYISRGDNFFLVGDMKQSIYRFRKSDPMLFKEKSDTFKKRKNVNNRKITLKMNFRSRKEVLDSVNSVFEKIMSPQVGDIDYNDEQRLYAGNTSYEDVNVFNNNGYISECYILEGQPKSEEEETESVENAEIEAAFIAKKIARLKRDKFLIKDGDSYRPIQNSDITILMSSYKSVSDIYIQALNEEGIECFAETGGYFDKNEVRIVLALIKVIQNPYQDIPLIGVLRSPIFGFSDDELVLIRKEKEGHIFDAIKEYSKKGDELSKKCVSFALKLSKWREYTKYMSCDKLIWTLYEETGIYAFVGALYGGEEAQANLRLLFERAKQYENSGFKGLFNFVRYIKKLEKREEDLSGAKLVGEGHNVVKIMTIHKSKGLEFPVVFLAGCGKKFMLRQDKIPMHKDLGMGLMLIDKAENYKMSTIAYDVVTAAERRENLSEEQRKLYVAMTRAKEKLFVTGVVSSPNEDGIEKNEAKWDKALSSDDKPMEEKDVSSADRFIDWVAPVAKKSGFWRYETVHYTPYFSDYEDEETETLKKEKKNVVFLNYVYPYENLESLPTKVSVTALKNAQKGINIFKNTIETVSMPDFMKEEQPLSGAQRGTALHTAMQRIDYKEGMDIEYINKELENLVDIGLLSDKEKESISSEKILKFYESEIGKRVVASDKVYREEPFETLIPASVIDGYENSGEEILLQGIIDCYFEEDGQIVIIDYKTDYYNFPDELRERYKSQLDWYGYAINKITGKEIKEKIIYLLYGDEYLIL